MVAMSLLKPGKFLKRERKIKKDKGVVMFILLKAQGTGLAMASVPTGWAGAVLFNTMPKRYMGRERGLTPSY